MDLEGGSNRRDTFSQKDNSSAQNSVKINQEGNQVTNQYRNPKNRKLYTSIGAYAATHGRAPVSNSFGVQSFTSTSGSALGTQTNKPLVNTKATQQNNRRAASKEHEGNYQMKDQFYQQAHEQASDVANRLNDTGDQQSIQSSFLVGRQIAIRNNDGGSMLHESTDLPMSSLPNHSGQGRDGQMSLDQGDQQLNNSVVVGRGANSKGKRHGKTIGKKKSSTRAKIDPGSEFGVIKSENFVINQQHPQQRGGSQISRKQAQVGNYVQRSYQGSKEELVGDQGQPTMHSSAVGHNSVVSEGNVVMSADRGSVMDQNQTKQQRLQQKMMTLGGSTQKQQFQQQVLSNQLFDQFFMQGNMTEKRPQTSFKVQTPQNNLPGKRTNSMLKKPTVKMAPQVQMSKENVRGSFSVIGGPIKQQKLNSGRQGMLYQGQQLSIGADGLVGIPTVQMLVNSSQKSGNGQRKKNNAQQVSYGVKQTNVDSKERQLIIGKTQRLNQLSVYQNGLINADTHMPRESRRPTRGGSSGPTDNQMQPFSGHMSKEYRELRTSSANAAMNTNGFQNLTEGTTVPLGGYSGTALKNQSMAQVMNMPAYTANNGLSDNSMHSNGGDAMHSIAVNKIMHAQGNSKNSLNNTTGSNNMVKGSKRNFKSGLTMSNDKQMMALQNSSKANVSEAFDVHSLRSGDRRLNSNQRQQISMSGAHINQALEMQLAIHQSEPLQNVQSKESARQAFLQAVVDQQNQAQTMHAKSVQKSNRNQQNSAQNAATAWTHQQSMQKFLQQQVITNPQNQTSTSGQGVSSMFSSAQGKTKKSQTAQRAKQTQILQSHYASQQNTVGQRKAYLAAIKGIKASAQKVGQSQINGQLLASDRLYTSNHDVVAAVRKGGTQTAIGIGGGNKKVLNSSQMNHRSSKNDRQSLSRSRISQGKDKKNQSYTQGNPMPLSNFSGTPAINKQKQPKEKVSNSRNFYTQMQNTKNKLEQRRVIASSASGNQLLPAEQSISISSGLKPLSQQQMVNRVVSNRYQKNPQIGLGSPSAEQNSYDANAELLSMNSPAMKLQNFQIKIVESAVEEMKIALNQGHSDDLNRAFVQSPSAVDGKEMRRRPQSQNDAQQLNMLPKSPYNDDVKIGIGSSARSDAGNEDHDEIDKAQYLGIVSTAFNKIIACLDPQIGSGLTQIQLMYEHFIEQIETNHQEELQSMAAQIEKTAPEVERLRQQVGELTDKNEKMTRNQKLADRLRDGLQEDEIRQEVGISVIDNMKRDLAKPDELMQDSSMQQILEGLPDFEKADVIGQNNEDVVRKNKQGRCRSRLDHIDASRAANIPERVPVGFQDELTEQEVLDAGQLSSISRYELAGTEDNRRGLGDSESKRARALSDDRAMEFDEEDDAGGDLRDGQQSYFSSHLHSSSDTINSEIRAYQEAIRQQNGDSRMARLLMSDKQHSADPSIEQFVRSDPDLGKKTDLNNHIMIHDKSARDKAKVPSLDFDRLREQIKRDNAQEEAEQVQQNVLDNDDLGSSSNLDMAEMAQLVTAIDGGMPADGAQKQIQNPTQKEKPVKKFSMPAAIGSIGGNSMGLDLSRIKHEQKATGDFQDEFMAKFDEFSESWRRLIEKQKRF